MGQRMHASRGRLARQPYLSAALGEATISVGRTQSFLGAK
jgi:hypothetical protein